jgi:hypothetical protein
MAAAVLATALVACSDDNVNGPSGGLQPSATYLGFVSAPSGSTSALSITFASAVALRAPAGQTHLMAAVTGATGEIKDGNGGTIALTGSLDGSALSMTGAGVTLAGTLSEGQITGSVTVPGAALAGAFAAVSSTTTAPARAYCGTFSGTSIDIEGGSPESGTFNLVVAADVLQGASVGVGGVFPFTGTASTSGGELSIAINQSDASGRIIANGTTQNSYARLTGTYETQTPQGQRVATGTFVGVPCPGQPSDAFEGTWDATKVEYTSVANPATKVDLIALGGAFVVTLDGGGTFQASLRSPGETVPALATGTWSVEGGTFTLAPSTGSPLMFSYTLSGTTLTVAGATDAYDFNGDQVPEAATLGGVFVKR